MQPPMPIFGELKREYVDGSVVILLLPPKLLFPGIEDTKQKCQKKRKRSNPVIHKKPTKKELPEIKQKKATLIEMKQEEPDTDDEFLQI
jgi:hypothetical protein